MLPAVLADETLVLCHDLRELVLVEGVKLLLPFSSLMPLREAADLHVVFLVLLVFLILVNLVLLELSLLLVVLLRFLGVVLIWMSKGVVWWVIALAMFETRFHCSSSIIRLERTRILT